MSLAVPSKLAKGQQLSEEALTTQGNDDQEKKTTILVLCSFASLKKDVIDSQDAAFELLKDKGIPYLTLDASKHTNKDRRDELYALSFRFNQFPQFFLVEEDTGHTTFWGDWKRFRKANQGDLAASLQRKPPKKVFIPPKVGKAKEEVSEEKEESPPAVEPTVEAKDETDAVDGSETAATEPPLPDAVESENAAPATADTVVAADEGAVEVMLPGQSPPAEEPKGPATPDSAARARLLLGALSFSEEPDSLDIDATPEKKDGLLGDAGSDTEEADDALFFGGDATDKSSPVTDTAATEEPVEVQYSGDEMVPDDEAVADQVALVVGEDDDENVPDDERAARYALSVEESGRKVADPDPESASNDDAPKVGPETMDEAPVEKPSGEEEETKSAAYRLSLEESEKKPETEATPEETPATDAGTLEEKAEVTTKDTTEQTSEEDTKSTAFLLSLDDSDKKKESEAVVEGVSDDGAATDHAEAEAETTEDSAGRPSEDDAEKAAAYRLSLEESDKKEAAEPGTEDATDGGPEAETTADSADQPSDNDETKGAAYRLSLEESEKKEEAESAAEGATDVGTEAETTADSGDQSPENDETKAAAYRLSLEESEEKPEAESGEKDGSDDGVNAETTKDATAPGDGAHAETTRIEAEESSEDAAKSAALRLSIEDSENKADTESSPEASTPNGASGDETVTGAQLPEEVEDTLDEEVHDTDQDNTEEEATQPAEEEAGSAKYRLSLEESERAAEADLAPEASTETAKAGTKSALLGGADSDTEEADDAHFFGSEATSETDGKSAAYRLSMEESEKKEAEPPPDDLPKDVEEITDPPREEEATSAAYRLSLEESEQKEVPADDEVPTSQDEPGDSKDGSPTVLILVSNQSLKRDVVNNQRNALHALEMHNIPTDQLDGADAANKDTRNDLFELSGQRGQYPQFFIVKDGDVEFWGDWDRFEQANESGRLAEELGFKNGTSPQPGTQDAAEETDEGGAAETPGPEKKPAVVVLCSHQSFKREVGANQAKAFHALASSNIDFKEIDGADLANKDKRNELFALSGLRGEYPQFFVVKNGEEEFWGDWDRFEQASESGRLAEELGGLSGNGEKQEPKSSEQEAEESSEPVMASPTVADVPSKPGKVLVLCSNQSLKREVVQNQLKALTALESHSIPFEQLDGADPANREKRNELFNISGLRGEYPQFFIVDKDGIHFWGAFDRFDASCEAKTLVPDFGNLVAEEDDDAGTQTDGPPDDDDGESDAAADNSRDLDSSTNGESYVVAGAIADDDKHEDEEADVMDGVEEEDDKEDAAEASNIRVIEEDSGHVVTEDEEESPSQDEDEMEAEPEDDIVADDASSSSESTVESKSNDGKEAADERDLDESAEADGMDEEAEDTGEMIEEPEDGGDAEMEDDEEGDEMQEYGSDDDEAPRREYAPGERSVLVLCASQSAEKEVEYNQMNAVSMLDAYGIPFTTMDGADPVNKEIRDELFRISGCHGQYPLFFHLINGIPEFWGNWQQFLHANEHGHLVDELL